MGFWELPFNQGNVLANPGGVSSNLPTFTTVTCGATPHVKTSWTQLVASSGSDDWYGFWVMFGASTNTSATDTSALLDVAVGAAASEQAVVSDLPVGYLISSGSVARQTFFVPLFVPAGVRVSARIQSAVANKAYSVAVLGNATHSGLSSGSEVYGRCTTYGTNSGTSQGVTVAPSASNATFGSWTELTSSTTYPMHGILLGIQAAGGTVVKGQYVRCQIGAGAGGSEVAVCNDLWFYSDTNEYVDRADLNKPITGFDLPAGTRLAARLAVDTTSGTSFDLSALVFTR